ncbi:MAG: phenylacetic acid degradation bifunctional protein PaaZ [Pikeienuella sp.]|uniref:phenylacetic acid degradation bifunctional protein PaaZ n=1 Tax=Pikeienuella sp. TaxID=2831957 RepID=UPI00391C32F8
MLLTSYAAGEWVKPEAARPLHDAATGALVAECGTTPPDVEAMADHARRVGGPALRAVGFHDRARMLKALATALNERKEELYALSFATGATRGDGAVDIEGGIGTLFSYASQGRKGLPDGKIFIDGPVDSLSRSGAFKGMHVAVPLRGVAVAINAFNFPVWGMLEKLAQTMLAGVPVIVKPATETSYLTHACFRMIVESGALPEGAAQLICGPVGDLLDRLGPQDAVSFTGSAATAARLKANPSLLKNAVRFHAEQDSLNAAILGPDAAPGAPEWEMALREAAREITVKAGQKCTAIRRILLPRPHLDAFGAALSERLAAAKMGDPRDEATRLGALAGLGQKADVAAAAASIGAECETVWRGETPAALEAGAFLAPILFRCDDPLRAKAPHEVEAFGPVATLMPYEGAEEAAEIANRGGGALVASVFTHDAGFAASMVAEAAAWHGRLYFADRDAGKEATGHGAPVPLMIHGGPGRAGGGEELGGVRGVLHYMQRTAVQGSPRLLSAITGTHVAGAPGKAAPAHPFTRRFGELEIGETILTPSRTVTLEDIEHFAHFTGDTFYAHMDEAAAKANPFFPGRVAHGYLLLSFAAGLFVHPDPGPVLANTGLNGLSFQKPVSPGEEIAAHLTVKRKTRRNETYGEVAWEVRIVNAAGEQVAEYELLTMVAH